GDVELVSHPGHSGVDRVDRQQADDVVEALVLYCADATAAALADELHLYLAHIVERGDYQVWVVHLDTRGRRDVGGGDVTGAGLAQVHGDRLVVLGGDDEALEVEDHLGHDLLDALDGRELVEHVVDPDAGDRRPRDGGEQGAPQRVAERVAEAGLQRDRKSVV